MAPIIYYLGKGDASTEKYYEPYLKGLPWTTFLRLDRLGIFISRLDIICVFLRKFGHDALWLQAVPFALAHVGKPEIETLSTIFGGFAFGWVAWRTKLFVLAVFDPLVHCYFYNYRRIRSFMI